MWHDFAIASCLVLVIEGVLPFAAPRAWRGMVMSAARLDDRALRIVGLCCMLAGTGLLYLVN